MSTERIRRLALTITTTVCALALIVSLSNPVAFTIVVLVTAWVGHLDDGSRLLVRLYTDGSVTAERRVVGAYMGELALTPEPVPS